MTGPLHITPDRIADEPDGADQLAEAGSSSSTTTG